MVLRTNIIIALCLVALLAACGGRKKGVSAEIQEDKQAKALLQGIWVNEDEEDVAFKAKGDSIFYPDTVSQPVRFMIVKDTLVLIGANTVKYPIVKQAAHLFVFKNQNGETVRLTKSENPSDGSLFTHERPKVLNQNQLIKRDTVLVYGEDRYHSYVQVNPTTYKVVKTVYNDEGVEVGNVYYDNIVHVSLFRGSTQLYSHDFRKKEFAKLVPAEYLRQAVLSDIVYDHATPKGFTYCAQLLIPDGSSSYMIMVTISFEGKMTMGLR